MPNGHLEKIGISKRVFGVFVKKKTLDYTGEPSVPKICIFDVENSTIMKSVTVNCSESVVC